MISIDEIKVDWRKSIKELEKAEQEYSKYQQRSIESGEVPEPAPLDKMKSASDKLMVAKGKERKYFMEYLEAVKQDS